MATKKRDFEIPKPPRCLVCNNPVRPEAVIDYHEAHLCWSEWCEQCKEIVDVEDSRFDIDWPFTEDTCKIDDLKDLGFTIILA